MTHPVSEPHDSSKISAQDAIQQAEQRAQKTAALNIANLEGLPVNDTANLREGPPLHESLLTLLPLVGVWRGTGEGHDTHGDYRFGQQITITHDGRPFLYWESRSWRLNEEGQFTQLDLRETGFWRCLDDSPQSHESHTLELVLAHADGYVELLYGYSPSITSWELVTDALARTPSTSVLGGAKRLYGLIENGDLAYVEERLNEEGVLAPRLSARLSRIIG